MRTRHMEMAARVGASRVVTGITRPRLACSGVRASSSRKSRNLQGRSATDRICGVHCVLHAGMLCLMCDTNTQCEFLQLTSLERTHL